MNNQNQEILQSTPQFNLGDTEDSVLDMNNHDGEAQVLQLRQIKPEFILSIQSTEKMLLKILPNGDVEAEDIESASEAGKMFVEAIRMQGKPLFERIQQLEEENELLKEKIKTYEVRKSDQVY